jgi:hypothetical protein
MGPPAHVASTAAEAHERALNAEAPVYVTDGDQTYQGVLARSPGAVSNGEPDVDPEAAPILRPDTPLAECIPLVLDADVPAVVLDAEGQLLGVVDREAVLAELTRNAGRPAAARS